MADASYGSLPFREQIAFFRRKLNITTQSWLDVFEAQHDHAFMVAGANRMELVQDFREAVDAAIANGETLQQFRQRFDAIVAKYGWDYNGGRNWRSRVIYETNLRTSYAAGRFAQLQSIKRRNPYWEYVHADGENHPRPLHLAWDGLVLDADDPWWHAHFPPNGWGCRCTIRARSARDLAKLGKTGPDTAPPTDMQTVTVGQRSPGGPRDVQTPAGVDPGFGYKPGRDAWLRQQAADTAAKVAAQDKTAWEPLNPAGPADFGRPPHIPLEPLPVPLGPALPDKQAVVDALRKTLGAEQRIFDVHGLPVLIDAEVLGAHLDDLGRAPYLALLPDLLTNPFEVWVSMERNTATGAMRTRARVIKGYDLGNGKAALLIADQQDGQLIGWTFMPSNLAYANKQRVGDLWYGKN